MVQISSGQPTSERQAVNIVCPGPVGPSGVVADMAVDAGGRCAADLTETLVEILGSELAQSLNEGVVSGPGC
jgi:hypothetical protein